MIEALVGVDDTPVSKYFTNLDLSVLADTRGQALNLAKKVLREDADLRKFVFVVNHLIGRPS